LVLRRRPDKNEDENRSDSKNTNNEVSALKLEARMDAMDRRLDNIDSTVSAVAERVMSRPLIMNATCPHCGKNMEITLIGSNKPTK
jgi:hypothetical protein